MHANDSLLHRALALCVLGSLGRGKKKFCGRIFSRISIFYGNILQEPLQGESANEQGVRIEQSWKESWVGGQQTCPLYNIYINMLIVSSDASIQKYHWQQLSVHLWVYCNHPTHDVNEVWRLATPQGSMSPTLFEQQCGLILLCPTRTDKCNCCETGPTVLCPYLRRKSNCLQMS